MAEMHDWLHGTWLFDEGEDGYLGIPYSSHHPMLELDTGDRKDTDGYANCGLMTDDGSHICKLWAGHDGPHIPLPKHVCDKLDLHITGLAG